MPIGSTGRPAQLLVYRFAPGAEFQGRLVGAIERIESGGTLRILDVLFVMQDPEAGELVAIELRGRGQGSLVTPLLGFRLDAGERRRLSEKSLRADGPAGMLRRLTVRHGRTHAAAPLTSAAVHIANELRARDEHLAPAEVTPVS